MITGLLSLKVATIWLSNETLGLWNFLFATVSYFALLEFGFGQGVARLLGEPLAAGDNEKASQLVTTGLLILAFQGILVLVIGLPLGNSILNWAGVPPHLKQQAVVLWWVIVLVRGLSLPLVILHAIIWVQNRVYIVYGIGILGSWIGLAAFYYGLICGANLLAYSWSLALPALLTAGFLVSAILRNSQGIQIRRSHFKWAVAGEIFGFSSAVFVTTVIPQLSSVSQSLIATRVCGLEATAVLAVNTRIGQLMSTIAMRAFDAFIPRWAATYCESGMNSLRDEYVRVCRLVFLGMAGTTVAVLLCNRPFIEWWTRADLFGGPLLTVVAALTVLFQGILRLLTYPFMLTRNMRRFAWVLACGLVIELVLQVLFASYYGLAGLVVAIPVAGFLLVFWFAALSFSRIIGTHWWHVFVFDTLWCLPSLVIATVAGAYWIPAAPPFTQLALLTLLGTLLVIPIGWRTFQLGRTLTERGRAVVEDSMVCNESDGRPS